jgi:hypothetical protein
MGVYDKVIIKRGSSCTLYRDFWSCDCNEGVMQ